MERAPRIAIVGRPNVGKSTLFNRLVGRRTALVSDMPGLTRDRRETPVNIDGLDAILIDTAGLEEAADKSIPGRMRHQSELAIDTADLVLFVIDARAGITPADQQFADAVRRSGRPVVLAANKCEGQKGRDGAYEAYALGLGEPIAVSAEHGEGLYDLSEAILAWAKDREKTTSEPLRSSQAVTQQPTHPTQIEAGDDVDQPIAQASADARLADGDEVEADAIPDPHPRDRPVKMAIVGRPNAGKSTLVNALLGEERMITGPEPGLTRDAIATPFTWRGKQGSFQFQLYDTAGLRRRSRIDERAEKLSVGDALKAVRFAEVVVLVIDADRPFEHQDLAIAEHVVSEGRALIVAVNKWDLVTDKQQRLKSIRQTAADKLAQVPGVLVVPVSALAEQGLDRLMSAALATYQTWNRRISTSDLNRWLVEAVARHAPPAIAGRRVKIRYITQPSSRPPSFVAFASQPQALPKSYERYLLNSLRETFEMPSVPIRLSFRKGDNPYAKS